VPAEPGTLRGADRIARRLYEAGCRFAFGIPGGEVLALMDALDAVGLRFVLVRHENSGGFMAEGTWHVTGAPGVLLATIGPGATNLVNVVANAEQDRVPLVVLTGAVDPADAASFTHQVLDHRAVLGPITKASFTLAPGAIEATMDRALAMAMDGRPGPVHIDVPTAVAEGASEERSHPPRPRVSPSVPHDLSDTARALERAERPLILAGLDVVNQDAGPALARFADRWGAPILCTYKAKGAVDETHPRALAAFGLSPKADALLLPLVHAADVIVLAGYDPIEVRKGWRQPFDPHTHVIAISAEADTHGVHRMDRLFAGDVGATLDRLSEALEPRARWASGEPEVVRSKLTEAYVRRPGFGPDAIIDTISSALPHDARLTLDTGAHRILFCQRFAARYPRQILESVGLGTMGCALPLAIGAKLAEPARPVVAIMGDAGLEMVLGELSTARDLRLPVVVVVIDDRGLALIETKQRAAGLRRVGVDLSGTDFASVATALGGHGVRVEDEAALGTELASGLARRDRFTLIHCPIEMGAYDGLL
jgi:acetolactate synthase-1/2/3 large subunit